MDPQFTTRFLGELHGRSETAAAETHLTTTLQSAFESIVRGDFDAFAEHVTEDVELHINGSGLFDGSWHGRAEVVAAARKNYGQLRDQKPEIEAMISEGNTIAILLRETGVVRADETVYRVRAVQWFTFAGGRIGKIDQIAARV
jgi:ketosteroid isomerase-like protein